MIGKAAKKLRVYELKVVDRDWPGFVRVVQVKGDLRLDVMAELVVRGVGFSGGPKWWMKVG